jgi:hypothetical protein
MDLPKPKSICIGAWNSGAIKLVIHLIGPIAELIALILVPLWNDKTSRRFVAGARDSDAAVDGLASTLIQATLAVHA